MKPISHSVAEILLDPTASYWLKDAISTLNNRDTLDALHDAEILHEIFAEKFHKEINSIN